MFSKEREHFREWGWRRDRFGMPHIKYLTFLIFYNYLKFQGLSYFHKMDLPTHKKL